MLTFVDGVAITASLALIVGSLSEQWRRDRAAKRADADMAQAVHLVAEAGSRNRHPSVWS